MLILSDRAITILMSDHVCLLCSNNKAPGILQETDFSLDEE